MSASAGYTAMMLRRACISFCFTLVALVLTLGVLMVPDVVLAAGAMIPNRGIPSSYHATLQHTARTRGIVMIQATRERWSCGGTRCEGLSVRHFDVASCRVLAQVQGPVASFVYYDGARRTTRRLTPAQLRQCNGGGQRTPTITVHVGRSHSPQSRPAPNTVRTGRLVLIGKREIQPIPGPIRTGRLILIGKPEIQPAPNSVRTGRLVLIGKREIQPIPSPIRTGRLILIGKMH